MSHSHGNGDVSMDTSANTVTYSKKSDNSEQLTDTHVQSDVQNTEDKLSASNETGTELDTTEDKLCDTAEYISDINKDTASKDSVYTDAECAGGAGTSQEEGESGGRVLLEVKPFEGSTDTLTGDLAHTQCAKWGEGGVTIESDRTDKCDASPGSIGAQRLPLSPGQSDNVNIKGLIQSATVSTSTTDISDSSVTLQHALVLQPSGGTGHVGLSSTMTRPGGSTADSNILSLHIPAEGRSGAGRTLDLLVCNPPSLQQTAAAGEKFQSYFTCFRLGLKHSES